MWKKPQKDIGQIFRRDPPKIRKVVEAAARGRIATPLYSSGLSRCGVIGSCVTAPDR